ncbi:hypothetical protein SmJEL517_g01556 [Synchytrium microbalum]|uniref:Uncharacterized protein n=1 Tax=Synchytrium microbalum TaxID=1806994 RepID=A0A507CB13_9FUNG|nr:uncharacterized protein SmJEL517_g01556 [Synchytrium microbalum]TPX36369.1 hypothetical protein SmJEL517_g01556 [Synchytrium microbalum]
MSGSKLLAPFKVPALPLGRNNILFHSHIPGRSPLHSSINKPNELITAAQKTTAKLHKMWEAPEKSVKKRTFDLKTYRIPIEESFCMSLPSLKGHYSSSLGEVEVAFVGSLQQRDTEQKLYALAKSRDAFHRRWFALSCLCLPFFLSLSVLSLNTNADAANDETSSMISKCQASQKDQVALSKRKPGVWAVGTNSKNLTGEGNVTKGWNFLKSFENMVLRHMAVGDKHGAAISQDGDLLQFGYTAPRVTIRGKDLVQVAIASDYVVALSKSGEAFAIPASQSKRDAVIAAREKLRAAGTWKDETSWFTSSNKDEGKTKLVLPKGEKITSIASGSNHVVALTNKGNVYSLGLNPAGNKSGQLGLGHTVPPTSNVEDPSIPSLSFTEVGALDGCNAVSVACGDEHTLVLTKDGRVFAHGSNNVGQLGIGTYGEGNLVISTPVEVSTLWSSNVLSKIPKPLDAKVSLIAAGGNTSLFAVDRPTSVEVFSAGNGLNGQLGNGAYTHAQYTPTRVKQLSGLVEYDEVKRKAQPIRIAQLSVSSTHCAGVLDTLQHEEFGRDCLVWGMNENWNLGTGNRASTPTPVYPYSFDYNAIGVEQADVDTTLNRLHIASDDKIQPGTGRAVIGRQEILCAKGATFVYTHKLIEGHLFGYKFTLPTPPNIIATTSMLLCVSQPGLELAMVTLTRW